MGPWLILNESSVHLLSYHACVDNDPVNGILDDKIWSIEFKYTTNFSLSFSFSSIPGPRIQNRSCSCTSRALPGQARIEPEDQSWLKRSVHILTHIPRLADARNMWIYVCYIQRSQIFCHFLAIRYKSSHIIQTRDRFGLLIIRIFILGPTEINK